ncbi:MAG: HEPN domain-containing protein [Chloroflexi bacterium]|nr:HEPN domain-containing protein [Chloroflexota bacterium]
MPDSPDRKTIAAEWFDRGDHDIDSAKLLFQQGGHTDTIAVLIQQAVEKYLKGYLLARSWKLRRIHDLEALVTEAENHENGFASFLDFARELSAFYFQARYPPGPPRPYPREQVADVLMKAEALIKKIKEAAGP